LIQLGFALTQHCNLRCAHCIRDDVTSFAEIDIDLVLRVIREARAHVGVAQVSFTGGEPLLHRGWNRLIDGLQQQNVPYSFVSNGWHMQRFMPAVMRYPPAHVRLSLSGADEVTHDAERGRDSFRRVLHATLLLATRGVPVSWSFIIDRRTRHQLRLALDTASSLHCEAIRFILPQPVPASAQRDTDLPPHEWWDIRREVEHIAHTRTGNARVILEYGAPFDGPPALCGTMKLERFYVDVHGRLSTCCQLSDYGGNSTDVVTDLNTTSFADAAAEYTRRIHELEHISAPTDPDDALAAFPCMRCARATGKLHWLTRFPTSPWRQPQHHSCLPVLHAIPLT
jgi:MoaA/NifB/PqqE/SkfB family radical SAM enzyme